MLERLSLRLRVFLFFAGLATGSIAVIAAGLVVGYRHLDSQSPASAFVLSGTIAALGVLGLTAWVWLLFDENVARAILKLAGGIRARAHAAEGVLDVAPARYLGDLAPAAAAVTETLAETRNALAEAVQRETTRLAEEKGRLEALLADVPVGVVLCSASHQVVFYNGQAVEALGAGPAPGLDRPLFDVLREAPVRHAYDRLAGGSDREAASDFICATVTGARLLSARMRLAGEGAQPGYVLTLRDVTADMAAAAGREALLGEIFDRIRRQAGNLQSLVGVVASEVPGTAAEAGPVAAALSEEARRLARSVTELAERHDAGRTAAAPLAPVRAADLAEAVGARAEAEGTAALPVRSADLILRCDGFRLVLLLSSLAGRIAARPGAGELSLEVREDGAGAMIELGWSGPPLSVADLDGWIAAPIEADLPGLTGRGVLDAHATECWPEPRPGGRWALCLPLREARRAARRPEPIRRRVVYDFDLLSRSVSGAIAEAPLDTLTFVVFDTETTGLSPAGGDEIVQIAAVRVVNGRRVPGEVFDTLVNPGRPIPHRSTEVHGITDAMVADAPQIEAVGRDFHRFCEGAVLVAHNAPFDMEFLRRHEAAIGRTFDHPILDTVLLSAVVFGQSETHSLDALAHRLGITIPEEVRHTAIGDTEATAEAFLRLLPMLRGRGLSTFGDVLAEVRQHRRLLRDLNA